MKGWQSDLPSYIRVHTYIQQQEEEAEAKAEAEGYALAWKNGQSWVGIKLTWVTPGGQHTVGDT